MRRTGGRGRDRKLARERLLRRDVTARYQLCSHPANEIVALRALPSRT
jgi:hypothetical protein